MVTKYKGQHTGRAWLVALVAALAVYLGINWMLVWKAASVADSRATAKALAATTILLFGFYCAVFGALATPWRIRWLVIAAFVVSITCNFATFVINGGALWRGPGVWLYSEFGQLDNLMGAWGGTIAILATVATMAVLLLSWLARRLRSFANAAFAPGTARALQRMAIAGSIALPVAGGFAQTKFGLAESNVYAFAIVALRIASPSPVKLSYQPTSMPAARKIVLVFDESTRPDTFAETVRPQIRQSAVDYRVGYSNANCSAASNVLVRLGIEPGKINVFHDPRTQPSLWAYAKQAGFKTTLLDGQLADSSKKQNFLGAVERTLIDDYVAADVGIETDARLGEQLAARLRTPDKELIYVIKRGSHFPYEATLPPEMRNAGLSAEDTYRAAVGYTTGRFFETLLRKSDALHDTLLFYTSDHGQYQGSGSTHCRADHAEDEYRVPLIALGEAADYLGRLDAAKSCWEGGAHHQAMRSSIIEALGYPAEKISSHLYPPLTACSQQREMPRLYSLPFPTAADEKLEFEMIPFRAASTSPARSRSTSP